jgi:proline-specific peptidase
MKTLVISPVTSIVCSPLCLALASFALLTGVPVSAQSDGADAAMDQASDTNQNFASPKRPQSPERPEPFAAPDRELMVDVDGGRVWVRVNGEIGPENPTPVIFIHGGPGGTHAKFAAMTGLADERAVIFYDQLGSGKSDRPDNRANWRVDRFIDELEAVRAKLGAEKLHLVGVSWGAAIALEYSVKYPRRVASTVLGGTYISTSHWLDDAKVLVNELSPKDRETLTACESETPPNPASCRWVFRKIYSRFYNPPSPPDAYLEYLAKYGGKGFNPLIYRSMWGPSEFSSTGILRDYDATPLLSRLSGRTTLFLIGQYDSARIDTVQKFIEQTPGAELAVVPGGGHGFLMDRPLETEALLRGWLRRQEPR